MQATDFQRFKEVMTGMFRVYERELDDLLLDAYWISLRDWTLHDFEQAVAHLLKTHTRGTPRPGHFEELRRAEQPNALDAWARVLKHIKGPYRNKSGLDDGGPIDQTVAGLGGYKSLAMREEQYLPIAQRQFAERFAEVSDVIRARGLLAHGGGPLPITQKGGA